MKGNPTAEDAPDGRRGPTAVFEHRVFVGRHAELAVLLHALAEAAAGRGGLVLLGGEPGIGKTRLASEFAHEAQAASARVFWGRCWEAGGAPAYWPWTQALRALVRQLDATTLAETVAGGGPMLAQLLPELRERLPALDEPGAPSPEVARFRLFNTLSDVLHRASTTQPLLLIIEDLHAADPSSLLLLQFVTEQLTASRMLVLGTYRDVDLPRDHILAATLPELSRAPTTVRLPLPGLSEGEVRRVIETITGHEPPSRLAAAVHRETAGNPLFVGELTRLLSPDGTLQQPADGQRWPIPDGVRDVIGRRLDRLSEDCRTLLALGSVVGRGFSVEVLQAVTGRTREALLETLHEAVTARVIGMVPAKPGRFAFAHALVRDTLYEDLAPLDRLRFHRLVGEALEHHYAGDPEPHVAEIAHHFFEAAPTGDFAKAIDYTVAAGRRAVRLLAYEEAVRRFRMAYRLLEEAADERRRCEVLLLLGDAQGRCGATAGSKESFLAAAEIATRLDVPELLARSALGYAGRLPWLRAGTDRHVIPLLQQALASVGEEGSVLQVLLLSRLAGALRDQPSSTARATLAGKAVKIARRIGDPETLIYALLAEWAATLLGPDGAEQQRVIADELNELAEQVQDHERLMDAHFARFVASMTVGQVWAAREQRELMVKRADELRQPAQWWYAGAITQILTLQDGRFEEAEELIDETLATGHRAQPWDAGASRLFALFILRREQGRLAELEQDLRRAPGEYPGYRSLRCMLLTLLCDLERLEEGRALFEQLAAGDFATFPKDNEWLFALTLLAEAAVLLGDKDRAATLYTQLSPYGQLVGLAASEVSVGPVTRPLGMLAGALGRHEEAAAHLKDAIERTRRMGSPPWRAHAQYAYAVLLADRGRPADRRQAAALLTDTSALCEQLGMVALHARTQALLSSPDARPGRMQHGPSRHDFVLTPREREVAALLAEGLSNRDIAGRLYVSERTAETHVQHILGKLGFTSRTQVAGWAVREGLAADGT